MTGLWAFIAAVSATAGVVLLILRQDKTEEWLYQIERNTRHTEEEAAKLNAKCAGMEEDLSEGIKDLMATVNLKDIMDADERVEREVRKTRKSIEKWGRHGTVSR